MKVTYTGLSDERRISADIVNSYAENSSERIDDDLVWVAGSTIDVPDRFGENLVESDREFRNPVDTTRDLRSKEELMERARELQISGRSSMNREELMEAIFEAEQPDEDDDDEADDSKDASGTT